MTLTAEERQAIVNSRVDKSHQALYDAQKMQKWSYGIRRLTGYTMQPITSPVLY